MRLFILFIFLVTNITLSAQSKVDVDKEFTSENNFFYKKSFNANDGYAITKIAGAVFDTDGWLWILGYTKSSYTYKFNTKQIILYRFDGANFNTVELPFSNTDDFTYINLDKTKNGHLALSIQIRNKPNSYYQIDTKNIQFEKLKKETYNKLELVSPNVDNNNQQLKIIKNDDSFLVFPPSKSDNPPYFNINKHVFSSVRSSRDYTKELFIFHYNYFDYYEFPDTSTVSKYLDNSSIRAIEPTSENTFIISTERKGWFLLDTKHKSAVPYKLRDTKLLLDYHFNRGIYRSDNGLWFNNLQGLCHYDLSTNTVDLFLPKWGIEVLKGHNQKLVYGFRNILEIFNISTRSTLKTVELDANILDLEVTDNSILIATTKGLAIYKNDKISYHYPNNNESDHYFISINKHNKNNYYTGTRNGKLFKFNTKDDTFQLIYEDETDASIASTFVDDKGTLWINTFAGFVNFNTETNEVRRFSQKDGFSHFEANRNSFYQLNDGSLLIGTLKGINHFFPDDLQNKNIDALLKLTSMSYYNKSLKRIVTKNLTDSNCPKNIELPAENRNLSLNFGVSGFLNRENISYRYKLNDNDWQSLENKSKLQLINISPGEYDLEIEVLSETKTVIGNAIKLHIKVKNFFYKMWWFYPLILLVLSVFGFRYFRSLTKRKNLQQQLSQNLILTQEKERSRIARELHDSVGQNLMLLTRKTKNSGDVAMETLATSTLAELRNISQGLHPASLERLGFTAAVETLIEDLDKQVEIFITGDIEDIDAKIPATTALHLYRVIQEILSNSIKHSKAKAVSVTIEAVSKSIRISIKDNGTGFNYKEQLEASKSLGLKSVLERCKIINATFEVVSEKNSGSEFIIILNPSTLQ